MKACMIDKKYIKTYVWCIGQLKQQARYEGINAALSHLADILESIDKDWNGNIPTLSMRDIYRIVNEHAELSRNSHIPFEPRDENNIYDCNHILENSRQEAILSFIESVVVNDLSSAKYHYGEVFRKELRDNPSGHDGDAAHVAAREELEGIMPR